jgi:subtilisin family serine protease
MHGIVSYSFVLRYDTYFNTASFYAVMYTTTLCVIVCILSFSHSCVCILSSCHFCCIYTHLSNPGIIGSKTYGVAKGVTLHSVRILDEKGGGTYAGLIAGIDYVRMEKENNKDTKIVANLSLGGAYYKKLNEAVESAASAGVVFIVAAGNSNLDACYISPAGTPSSITVGAVGVTDSKSYFSNYGTCIDVFAPGESITSLSAVPGVTNTYSGTSMAAPVVSGVAAIYLQAGKTVMDMLNDATGSIVTNGGAGSTDHLIYLNPDNTGGSDGSSNVAQTVTLQPTSTQVTDTSQPTLSPTQQPSPSPSSKPSRRPVFRSSPRPTREYNKYYDVLNQCKRSGGSCTLSKQCCDSLRCIWSLYGKVCR